MRLRMVHPDDREWVQGQSEAFLVARAAISTITGWCAPTAASCGFVTGRSPIATTRAG